MEFDLKPMKPEKKHVKIICSYMPAILGGSIWETSKFKLFEN